MNTVTATPYMYTYKITVKWKITLIEYGSIINTTMNYLVFHQNAYLHMYNAIIIIENTKPID